jgi:hypothetical protein
MYARKQTLLGGGGDNLRKERGRKIRNGGMKELREIGKEATMKRKRRDERGKGAKRNKKRSDEKKELREIRKEATRKRS